MLVALSAAALGSGAAILRAMTSALAAAVPGRRPTSHPVLAMVALALGAAVAARGQGIVDTMVSVNVVYIASVGVCFAALQRRVSMSPAHAGVIMAVGGVASLAAYLAGWAGWLVKGADIVSLGCGLGASVATALFLALTTGGWLRRASGPRR